MASGSTFRQPLIAVKQLGLALCAAAFLSACATTTQQSPGPVTEQPVEPEIVIVEGPEIGPEIEFEPEVKDPVIIRNGLTPPHMKGRDIKRLALILPFSAKSERLRAEAASMLKAAEMSVFAQPDNDVLLIALDTGGTADGAASAAQAAVKSGADVILGPVLARAVTAASKEARKSETPVIAFSTDQTVAGNGTYLLSFPPEAEVKRIVEFAAQTGAKNFAFLGPQSAYGQRVLAEYQRSVKTVGGKITGNEAYKGRDISVMQEPAKKLASFYKDHEKRTRGQARRAFEAIILPEGGTPLRSLAPLLPYYDVDPADVQFLGTGLWHKEDVVREPALNGGIFAGPPEDAKQRFASSYDQKFGEEPTRLASLAYDAVMVGAVVANGKPSGRHARAQDAQGFYGVDGLLRFNSNGTPDRGLAIYQIQGGKFIIIEPAPKTHSGPS